MSSAQVKGIILFSIHIHLLSFIQPMAFMYLFFGWGLPNSLWCICHICRCRSIFHFSTTRFLPISMALIRADAHHVPVGFPVGDDGYAMVTTMSLSLRFQF